MSSSLKSSYNILRDSTQFFNDLQDTINNAQNSVAMQFLTFEGDTAGDQVSNLLMEAAHRNLSVKLLIDYYSSMFHSDKIIFLPRLDKALRQKLIKEWKITRKLFNLMKESGILIKRTFQNHKKLIVVDNKIAYTGGINISDHNFSWHDYMIKIEGQIVNLLADDFEKTWDSRNKQAKKITFNNEYIISENFGDSLIQKEVIGIIQEAKKGIIIETPYLWGIKIPQALIGACRRKVNVSLITSLKPNRKIPLFSNRLLRKLRSNGVKVYLYAAQSGMTHAKMLLVDNCVAFGSSNFNGLTSPLQSELNIFSSNPKLIKQTKSMLQKDISLSIMLE